MMWFLLWGYKFERKSRASFSAKLCMSIHYTDHHINFRQEGTFKSVESSKGFSWTVRDNLTNEPLDQLSRLTTNYWQYEHTHTHWHTQTHTHTHTHTYTHTYTHTHWHTQHTHTYTHTHTHTHTHTQTREREIILTNKQLRRRACLSIFANTKKKQTKKLTITKTCPTVSQYVNCGWFRWKHLNALY